MKYPALLILLFLFPQAASAQSDWTNRAIYSFYASGAYKAAVGNWAGAAADFERAYRLSQTSSEILVRLAEANYKSGHRQEARKFAERALTENKAMSDAHVILAEIALEDGDLTGAEDHLAKRLERKPEDIESRMKLGLIRENRNDFEGAVRAFEGYPPRRPGAALAHFRRGLALVRLGRAMEARAAFRDSLRENPLQIEAAENIAILSEKHDDDTSAVEAWNRVLEINPMHVDAIKRKILLLLTLGRTIEGQAELERLLEISEDKSRAVTRLLAEVAIKNGDFSTAAKAMSHIAEDVTTETGFLEVAIVAAQSGKDTDLVIKSLEDAYRVMPSPRIAMMLIRTYLVMRENEKAGALSHLIADADSKETALAWSLGLLHHSVGDESSAISLLFKVIERDPLNAPALNYIGYTWAEKGIHLDRAEELIRRALVIDPENAQYLDSLGWVYFKLGSYEKAIVELERAIALTPGEPTILEHLGDAYLESGSKEKALLLYRTALETGKAEHESALRAKIQTLSVE